MHIVRTDHIPPPPLSPAERAALTSDDIEKVEDWQRNLNGYPPSEHDFLRLFLTGKASRRYPHTPKDAA